jgi:tRNA(Ile)-lysidine synthase
MSRPPAVARVIQRVVASARTHQLFEPGRPVVVAVSGGPDSLCLLHSLVQTRRLLRIHPLCFHFDHRLRPGSDADARYVRAQATRLGVPFVLRVADGAPARGQSPEAWARTVRYEALFRVVEEAEASAAAVGHTADDQAETVLLGLLRGSGLHALGGMEAFTPPAARPLLEVTRAETEAFCRALRLRPRRDPMNADPAYMRAALRLGVLPVVEEALGRGVREAVVRTAGLLRQDADYLDAVARDAARSVSAGDGRLRAGALVQLHPAVSSRVVRTVLMAHGLAPDSAHVLAVLDLAAGRPGRRRMLGGGLLAHRDREYVALSRPSPAARRVSGPQREGRASDGRG